jgi:uncharacterized protein YPO0396
VKLKSELASLTEEFRALSERKDKFVRISTYQDFSSIDWQESALDIERLKKEMDGLLAASNRLKELKTQLAEAQESRKNVEQRIMQLVDDRGRLRNRRQGMEAQLGTVRLLLTEEELRRHSPCFGRLDEFTASQGEPPISVEGCDRAERAFRAKLTNEKDSKRAKAEKIAVATVRMMTSFRGEYPLETQELDATMESAGEYGRILERLRSDDLPRFEAKFKELLNENTIREIANFQAQLSSESQDILDRIGIINDSLARIDYAQGRYIKLEAHRVIDNRVRGFQEDLRACTEGTITGSADDLYSEAKFQSVCRIIERFKGRPESSDSDAIWTEHVTDVRNWFSFSVSEAWRETGEEYEHYADSGGKSGGQKEKLAYTILAASLAYQFGMGKGPSNPRTFRFVMIDEAFGRGSDESAQFALSLFGTLNLQLLIATPMQKIHVIEPYISHVAFVRNEGGSNSCISNMTIEQYLEEKNAARG